MNCLEKDNPLILIVDDNHINTEFCRRILSKNGYKAEVCHSGEEALDFLENYSPDLILLDVVMPGIDGFEFCESIKSNLRLKETPVIFLSAMDDEKSIINGFKCGGVDYITRPFRTRELLARTKTHIDLKIAKEKLLKMAITDELTGLTNRRYFMERLTQEFERVKRYESFYTILMTDLDFFKKINDTYGHISGDTVLKKVALKIKEALRGADIVGRIGGEEFAVLLPETKLKASLLIAERLKEKIENMIIKTEGHEIKLTISLGASQSDISDATMDAAMIRADSALYNAKKQGRNKICFI